jgi:hypothetical protein
LKGLLADKNLAGDNMGNNHRSSIKENEKKKEDILYSPDPKKTNRHSMTHGIDLP